MRFTRKLPLQCDTNTHQVVAVDSVHTIPVDVELFATFTVMQVKEASLRLCELVGGMVLRL